MVRLATSSDNARLLNFYEDMRVTEGGLVLSYRRGPDFFRLLDAQGQSSLVFYLQTSDGAIEGIGSISFRDGILAGQRVRVGYLGDLRVVQSRHAVKAWRRFFECFLALSPLLEETKHCSHYLTAVLDGNSRATSALVRNRHGSFRYVPVMHYRIAMLVGRLPFIGRRSHCPLVREAIPGDMERLVAFLDTQNSIRPYGFIFNNTEWPRRLGTWEKFGLKNFLLAEDSNGTMVGCLALWNHPKTKRMVVEQMSMPIKILAKAQRIIGGLPLNDADGAIDVTHATHFEAAHRLSKSQKIEIRCALLDRAWAQTRKDASGAVLSFCDDADGSVSRALRGRFIGHTTAATLYRVNSSNENKSDFTATEQSVANPGFEMALV